MTKLNTLKKLFVALSIATVGTISSSFANYTLTVDATAYVAEGITAMGEAPIGNKTIAVDPSVIPLGSMVYVEGFGLMRANDTGGAINGNHIDIAMNSYNDCINFGRRTLKMTVFN